jgi:hypothetical protein
MTVFALLVMILAMLILSLLAAYVFLYRQLQAETRNAACDPAHHPWRVQIANNRPSADRCYLTEKSRVAFAQ